jgi:uncharacterized membrane protein
MNIKEIVLIVYLFFINIYKNIIDSFNCKKVKVDDEEPDSDNESQQYIEEIAEEVIERITEKYHLFKKEE